MMIFCLLAFILAYVGRYLFYGISLFEFVSDLCNGWDFLTPPRADDYDPY
jgi:hypothetical protein